MTYKYDVFLSYAHGFIEQWLDKHFIHLFKWHLEGGLGYPPEIFIDRTGISSGDSWPLRLKQALGYSKCLVPMWSPSYFKSKWCMMECNHMLNRENILGYRTLSKPTGLIIPVNVSDGKGFPNFGDKTIQYFDCRSFIIDGEGFKKTEKYVEFQEKLKQWIDNDVVKVIENVPDWNEEWLYMDDIITIQENPLIFDKVPG